jgi:RNA polymerase sigma-70 factor (ECF subfamily)
MLQVVFGLDAQLVARAFLVSPTTLSQRLVRAKAKIRDAGIAFDVPVGTALPPRLDAVLEAIYAAYGSGWDDLDGADPRLRGLTEAALMLVRVLIELLPDEPEALGLLALMLYCEARRESRRNDDGAYVPLSEQSVERWSAPMIEEANRALSRASDFQRPARFQLEAAIQAAHLERARTGAVDWAAIATLYEGLVRTTGALGAFVGRAAAVAELRGPADALSLLDDIPPERVKNYQPYWALRAHLLQLLGRPEADEAFELAIGLAEDPAIRRFLHARRHAVPVAGR